MSYVFVTGSTSGLGLAAAEHLIDMGHQVVLHARSAERAAHLRNLAQRADGVVIGDLANAREVRSVAEQANQLGRFDAVIHNAGIYLDEQRCITDDGHARVLAVNVLAPYMLTVLAERPRRLVYLSSMMHRFGTDSLDDIEWTVRPWHAAMAYGESKLLLAALSAGVARRWPAVCSNAVDPGWVPTRMGGPSASDDLSLGHVTQCWLAVSDDEEAQMSGRYWYHQGLQEPARAVDDPAFQDALIDELGKLTGVAFL
jgi:NAD(P)-dependent dehydrogenase (short-subunit alcohol dehydrogenase family)